mmetsp:Transcript_30233/g.49282  ORF Transcript_30233/g.49282 Transcript_30233/m.49282 type:complete len:339 (+) Transcript_30233:164-1180(+)
MDEWRKREEELLRRDAALQKQNEAAVEKLQQVVDQQGHNITYGTDDGEDEDNYNIGLELGNDGDHDDEEKNQEKLRTTFITKSSGKPLHLNNSGVRNEANNHRYEQAESAAPVLADEAANEGAALRMEEELAPGGLSLHATVRLQKARLIALEKALSKLSKENLEYNSQRKMWEKKLADTSELNKQLKRSLQKSEQQMGKSKKSLNEAVNKARNSERELQVAKKELSSAQREREQLRSNSKNLDLKLNRAFAEIDKLKGKVKTQRSHGKATGDASRKELIKANSELRKLQAHNKELVTAFKKQMKLIDVLKRQKLHMEAAKMLSFTEEEFAKTINFKG